MTEVMRSVMWCSGGLDGANSSSDRRGIAKISVWAAMVWLLACKTRPPLAWWSIQSKPSMRVSSRTSPSSARNKSASALGT